MGMVCSTFIAKGKLTSLKEIDSGSFGKIYSTTYDGVPGTILCIIMSDCVCVAAEQVWKLIYCAILRQWL